MIIKEASIDRILDYFRNSRTGLLISFVCILAIVNLITGCFYYKVVTQKETPSEVIQQHQEDAEFIMLHFGQQAWKFDDIEIMDTTLVGNINNFSGHEYYRTTRADQVNRYRKGTGKANDERDVLNEVHITIQEYSVIEGNRISVPLESIQKIEIYDPAVGATVGAWFFSGLGIAAVAFGIFMLILILTSCPFVYVFDGQDFTFTGEIYPGAIFPPLERHDYLPLPLLAPENGQYRIRIGNKVHEFQNTNFTQLIAVDHSNESEIYIDKYGEIYSCQKLQRPRSATNLKGKNILEELAKRDSVLYLGQEHTKKIDLTDGAIMQFDRMAGGDRGLVIIRAKNSYWLDYVFDRFHELFGYRYDTYMHKQAVLEREVLEKRMLDNELPVSLFVENKGEWEFIDYYNMAGPMILRDDVLAINLTDLDPGPLKIKLEYGTYFWELDYVGVDFFPGKDYKVQKLPVETAEDENGNDLSGLLRSDDTLYYIQPEIGNEAELSFVAPPAEMDKRSLYLHSKGHYEILRNNPSKPEVWTLRYIRRRGLPKYSIDLINDLYTKRTDELKLGTWNE